MSRKRPLEGTIDRSKEVKITAQLVHKSMRTARFMPPYFAHETLSASLYVGGKLYFLDESNSHD